VCYSYGCSTPKDGGTTHFSGVAACGHTKGDAIDTLFHPFIIKYYVTIVTKNVDFLRRCNVPKVYDLKCIPRYSLINTI
jgi:hypothetical protein